MMPRRFTDQELEEFSKLHKKSSPRLTWDDIAELYDLDICGSTLAGHVSRHLIAQKPKERKTPMLVDKFNWSFLNHRWNAGLLLVPFERKDWHHGKEKRDRVEAKKTCNTY